MCKHDELDQALSGWTQHGSAPAEAVAVDGKTMRAAVTRQTDMPHTQVVAAMNSRGEVAGQAAVHAGDENAAARDLITRLGRKALAGTVVTADAKHTSSAFIAAAEKAGAFWLLPVKGNRPGPHQQLKTLPCNDTRVDTRDRTRGHGPAVGELRMREIDNPKVGVPTFNRLYRRIRDESSVSSAKTVRAILSGVCGFAIRYGALNANPIREVGRLESRKAKNQRQKPRALTAEQVLDLLAKLDGDEVAVQHDLPDLVRLFLASGERTGEALAAHWPDFDQDRKLLSMAGNMIRAKGRGKILNRGKTENAVRPIPLPDWCVHMLTTRRSAAGNLDGPIFPSSTGTVREASNVRNRAWRPFTQRAGYEWVTFRTFRKTVATLLDEAGLTARQIADILGHSRPSMTQDVYMGRGTPSRTGAGALNSTFGNGPQ